MQKLKCFIRWKSKKDYFSTDLIFPNVPVVWLDANTILLSNPASKTFFILSNALIVKYKEKRGQKLSILYKIVHSKYSLQQSNYNSVQLATHDDDNCVEIFSFFVAF